MSTGGQHFFLAMYTAILRCLALIIAVKCETAQACDALVATTTHPLSLLFGVDKSRQDFPSCLIEISFLFWLKVDKILLSKHTYTLP